MLQGPVIVCVITIAQLRVLQIHFDQNPQLDQDQCFPSRNMLTILLGENHSLLT